jgi:hypothetical protein
MTAADLPPLDLRQTDEFDRAAAYVVADVRQLSRS